jgi:hypothetical protein
MRAILLASATATSLKGFFSISFFAQMHSAGVELTVKQHGMGADDEQFAQVLIAHLRNAPELRFAARRVLLGSQSEKGGELARPGETGRILNGRRHRRAVIGPKPGVLISRPAVSSFCASFAMLRSSQAIASSRWRNCTTSGTDTSHTSTEFISSQASISSASSRACLGPAPR